MTVIVYLVLGLVILYFYLRQRTSAFKTIPAASGWPFVGYAPYLKKGSEHKVFFALAEKYGAIFKLNMFGNTVVVLNSAELIRKAFSGEKYKMFMNDRPATFFGDRYMFGSQSIVFSRKAQGSEHGDLRKAFTRGMHVYGEGRRGFEDQVTTELVNFVDRIDRFQEKEFEFATMLKRSLTNVVSIILSGHDLKDDDAELNMFWDYMESVNFFLGSDVNLILSSFPFLCHVPGMYKDAAEKLEHARESILSRFVEEKKAKYKPGSVGGLVNFFLGEQTIARNKSQHVLLTDEKIKAQTLETISAGILTSLASLSSLFLCLMNYPEYQIKIQDEIDRVVGKDRLPSLSDKQACVFIEAVIMEAQRYVTIVPLAFAHLCAECIGFEGYEIPSQSVIIPNVWYVHHDEKIWGDPWNFRPERWLDENGELL